MAAYSLSAKAVADIDGIYEYTILDFGLEQARAYLLGLHERFEMLIVTWLIRERASPRDARPACEQSVREA